ncbi:MAG: DUF502 domain-containing protein [Firmicutes bacterium]|nr:DUF502 domain-containing protein [Bacillota bacterium]
MSRKLRNYFLAGLAVILPVTVTLYLLKLVLGFVDGLAGGVLSLFTKRHIPGIGLVSTVLVVLGVGLVATNVVGRRLVAFWDGLLLRIPLVNTVYRTSKQVVEALWYRERAFRRVVLVEYPRRGVWAVGFVTGETVWEDRNSERWLNVFVPTTPNPTSGFLLLFPPSEVVCVDLPVEEGIRMVVSGGIIGPEALRSGPGLPGRGEAGRDG